MSSKSVVVIGGGLAGLSAAVALAEAGYRITLLEKRPFLGGRATSYLLPGGEHVDNCQHITLGCCTNLDDFYRRAGAARKIRYFDRFLFCFPDGRRGTLKSSPLPAPLHLAPSFLSFPLLGWADKICIGRALLSMARSGGRPKDLAAGGKSLSMLEWLNLHKQTPAALSRFWGPVLVSALNEELARTDARYGVDVFWKGFIANRAGYKFGVPIVTLGELYEGCRAALTQSGGEARLRAPVRQIEIENNHVTGVSFESGEALQADHYVAAVPHGDLPRLLSPDVASQPVFVNLSKLRTTPITGAHLWFDRPVMNEPYITLLDSTTQWIFNKTLLYGSANPEDAGAGQHLQLVISASYGLVQRGRQEVIDECLAEVRRVLPRARDAQLAKSVLIKEANATFSPEPDCDQWRPAAAGAVQGLFLAGDWTATGWPATMEGAVRSGYLAAEAVTAADGHAQTFLRPDLPIEGLTKWIAKRPG